MQTPLQITFRDFEPTGSIEKYVRARADKLERFSTRITGCHVTIGAPHRHHRQGRRYDVRIDLTVPGGELVASRGAQASVAGEDVYASIDAAFDGARRLLRDHVQMQRDH